MSDERGAKRGKRERVALIARVDNDEGGLDPALDLAQTIP